MERVEFRQKVIEQLAAQTEALKSLEKQVLRQNGNVIENRKDIELLKLNDSRIFSKIDTYLERFESYKLEKDWHP